MEDSTSCLERQYDTPTEEKPLFTRTNACVANISNYLFNSLPRETVRIVSVFS